ncbi:hypothetical protein DFH06DRAFT_1147496 [Mycena polygramma]|nr:hypothetical protein DFH06DRAFT_1147496 [Mycena polygramma]
MARSWRLQPPPRNSPRPSSGSRTGAQTGAGTMTNLCPTGRHTLHFIARRSLPGTARSTSCWQALSSAMVAGSVGARILSDGDRTLPARGADDTFVGWWLFVKDEEKLVKKEMEKKSPMKSYENSIYLGYGDPAVPSRLPDT